MSLAGHKRRNHEGPQSGDPCEIAKRQRSLVVRSSPPGQYTRWEAAGFDRQVQTPDGYPVLGRAIEYSKESSSNASLSDLLPNIDDQGQSRFQEYARYFGQDTEHMHPANRGCLDVEMARHEENLISGDSQGEYGVVREGGLPTAPESEVAMDDTMDISQTLEDSLIMDDVVGEVQGEMVQAPFDNHQNNDSAAQDFTSSDIVDQHQANTGPSESIKPYGRKPSKWKGFVMGRLAGCPRCAANEPGHYAHFTMSTRSKP